MRRLVLSITFLLVMAVSGCISNGLVETKNLGNIREGYIMMPGGRVWYRIIGHEKKGIPLLVVNGGPGSPHDYLEPVLGLSDERPVIFYDQLGCGNSDITVNKSLWTIASFVDELTHVRSALKLKKVHILGQAWGTMLAVDYMLQERAPKDVISLVLSGPILSASRFNEDQKRYLKYEFSQLARDVIQKADASRDFKSKEYKDVMDIYYKRHFCRMDPWPDTLNRTLKKRNQDIYEYMWGPSGAAITGTLEQYERVEELGAIKVPVLFTCGRFDQSTTESTAIYRNALPGAEIAIFEDASHEHHLEKTREYIETVRGFLHRAEMIANAK